MQLVSLLHFTGSNRLRQPLQPDTEHPHFWEGPKIRGSGTVLLNILSSVSSPDFWQVYSTCITPGIDKCFPSSCHKSSNLCCWWQLPSTIPLYHCWVFQRQRAGCTIFFSLRVTPCPQRRLTLQAQVSQFDLRQKHAGEVTPSLLWLPFTRSYLAHPGLEAVSAIPYKWYWIHL